MLLVLTTYCTMCRQGKTNIFNVTVLNVNDAPTGIESEIGFTIHENMPAGAQVAILKTIDEDSVDLFTYHIDNLTDKFTITGNVISLLSPLNFEEQSTYQVEIKSTDLGGASITENHVINVVDVNDTPNYIFFVDAPVIQEDAAINTMLGRLNVSDEDEEDSHTFAVVDQSDYLTVDQEGFVYNLDYEGAELTLDVMVTDGRNAKNFKSLEIFVTNVNEAPYRITLSDCIIPENIPAGRTAAKVIVEDQDFNETFFCQLSQSSPPYFKIVNNLMHVTLVTINSTINYESTLSYSITLHCYDHGGLVRSENISITVVDKNDSPTQIIFTDALYLSDEQLLTVPTIQILKLAKL